jgi:hypothetical protein
MTLHSAINCSRGWASVLFLSILWVLLPGLALAQSSASLNGTVKDPSGAVITGATLNLIEDGTHFRQTSRTNGAGVHNFTVVPPGRYTLQVIAQGFRTVLQPSFQLEVNQTSTINFTLPVGSTSEEVVVSSQSIALETSTAELGTVVSAKEVIDLPLNGRNFSELLLLTPGASPVDPLQNKHGAPANIGSYVLPAVNGQSNRSNMFLLDGITNYANGGDTYAIQPTVDDILEFKAQSHNDEAQYGQVLGSIVNHVTRAGTNVFHGAAWEFFRNDSLDAVGYFDSQNHRFIRRFPAPRLADQFSFLTTTAITRLFYYGSTRLSQDGHQLTLFNTPTCPQLAVTPLFQTRSPFSRHGHESSDPAGSFVSDPDTAMRRQSRRAQPGQYAERWSFL